MLKKPITYTDFSGDEVTENFYFNLTKSELIEWEVKYDEGLIKLLRRVIETTDKRALISIMKELILKCYGEKSDDGKRFVKNDQLRENFSQTPAYDVLFMELATDDIAAGLFVQGILPKDLVEGIDLKQLTAEKINTIQNNIDTPAQDTVSPTPPVT